MVLFGEESASLVETRRYLCNDCEELKFKELEKVEIGSKDFGGFVV